MRGRWWFALACVVGAMAPLVSCGEELGANEGDARGVDASTTEGNAVDANGANEASTDAGCFIVWDASARVFTDVPPDAAGAKEVAELGKDGVLDACDASDLCPDQTALRRELFRWAVRAAYSPPPVEYSCEAFFTDIGPADRDYAYFHKAKQVGLVSGCDVGKACPDLVVSRAQLAVLATVLAKSTPLDASTPRFADVPPSNSLFGFIERAADLDLIAPCPNLSSSDGGDGTSYFCPEANATRRVVAITIDRARALR